jgi:hypothetical protein
VLAGRDPRLSAAYPPAEADDHTLWSAIAAAFDRQAVFIDRFLDGPPQTNEVARSAALIAAAHTLAARYGLPLMLSELGASAGLNLNWDRYALALDGRRWGPQDAVLTLAPENRGALPPLSDPRVVERRGVDLRPIDVSDPAQALKLRAYVWPDQAPRLDRLSRALTVPPAPVDAADAAPWLAARLATQPVGTLHLVCNTIAWQYFPDATKAACAAALDEAGARATDAAPLAHFEMENDGSHPGAVLSLRVWPGGARHSAGRFDFHGRWLDWSAPALA